MNRSTFAAAFHPKIKQIFNACCSRRRGYASVQGTKDYFEQVKPVETRSIPKTGWITSRMGFGGYRIGQEHKMALRLALSSGINLVDTSSHFGHGNSETCVGQVIRSLTEEDARFHRDHFVIISKAGYILTKGSSPPQSTLPDAVQQVNGNLHCIHPEFLEQELKRSLDRLQMDYVDFYLLNAPELLFSGQTESRVYASIQRAFQYLSTQVASGRIRGGYGIASNAFKTSQGGLLDLVKITEQSKEHKTLDHFMCIQYPLNLFELAAIQKGYNSDFSLAEIAKSNNLFQLIQRPINAIKNGSVCPLKSIDCPIGSSSDALMRISNIFEKALELELQLTEMLSHPSERELVTPFVWVNIIAENVAKLSENLVYAQHYFSSFLRPSLTTDLDKLRVYGNESQSDDLIAWCHQYESALDQVAKAVLEIASVDAARKSKDLLHLLNASMPNKFSTVSKHALHAPACALEEMHASACTLVGARRPEYVREMLELNSARSSSNAYTAVFNSPMLRMLQES